MKRSLIIALAVLILGSAAETSVAAEAQYRERYFMYWKPTFGKVQLDKDFLDPTKKTVYETFGWGTWVSMLRLDAPRTPTGDGMYEHEMRFNDEDGQGEWCTIDRGYNVIAKDLPSGAYHDDVPDQGEFTWGMSASLLVQDHVYDIKFRCWSNAPNSSEEFQQRSQASHCHTPCNQYSTYPDETVKPIPSAVGIAPSLDGSSKTFDIEATFTGNPSFETSPDKWHVPNGTKAWKCPAGGGSYHSSCHVRVLPNTGAQGKLQLTFTPPGAVVTGVNYNEFVVRCPTAPNGSACPMRVYIEALNGSGAVIDSASSPWTTVPRSDSWYTIRVTRGTGWPGTTVQWRFGIIADTNKVFDADYHQQHYELPR